MSKQNCWDVKNCGRQQGGPHVHDLGMCPAATEAPCNGLNGGTNGGRICWAISSTLCAGEIQDTLAQKLRHCLNCEFYQQVMNEEGGRLVLAVPHHAHI